MTTDTHIPEAEAVEIAAGVLDEHYPGWAQRVPVDTFHLMQAKNCIGFWAHGDGATDMSWQDVARTLENNSAISRHQSGEMLAANDTYRELWVAEIAKRKEAS